MYWIFYWRLSFWVQTLYMDRQGMGFCEEPLLWFREVKMGMRAEGEGGLTRMGVARQQVQFLQVLVAHNKSLHCSSTLLPLHHCANSGCKSFLCAHEKGDLQERHAHRVNSCYSS